MEWESSRAAQKREHTSRNRTVDLYFQSEFAVTSPREPDDLSERNPNLRDLLAEPFNSHSKHFDDFSKQGAQISHSSPCQKENLESYTMERNNEDLANVANLPIFEESDWYKVSRPGTILQPPLSPIQNKIIQHEFNSHFSDWLIHSATTSPNTCPPALALHGGKNPHLLHPGPQDLPDLEMQNMDISCSGYEPLEPNQSFAKTVHHELPPIEATQHLRPQSDAFEEFLDDENVLVPYNLDGFVPSDFVPIGLPFDYLPLTRDNSTRSVLLDHLFATGFRNVTHPRHRKREYISGTRLLSSVRSTEVTKPSHLSTNQMLSPPQSTREQSSFSQHRDEEAEDFLRAGRIYLASLSSAAATPVASSVLSNKEEFTWACNRLPVEVKKWLESTKEDRNSNIEPLLISNDMPFSSTTTLPSQIQHGRLVSKQKMGKGWDALHASRSASQLSHNNHSIGNFVPLIKYNINVRQNIEVAIPTPLSDTAMENNLVESDLVSAQHIKRVARIEERSEELQETLISDEFTQYPVPAQPRPSPRGETASHVSNWTGQGLLQPVFPTFHASGHTFVTPVASRNIVKYKRTSQMPVVPSFQSNLVEISPLSDKSFVMAESDEISRIQPGLSPECAIAPSMKSANPGHFSKGTETALSARFVAPLTNKLFGLHLASENRSLLDQQNQNANMMQPSLQHNSMSHEGNIFANPTGTAEGRDALSSGGDMLMADIVDKSVDAAPRASISNNASEIPKRISQGHELPQTQSKQLTSMKRQVSMTATKEQLQPSEAPGSKEKSSSAGKPRYFCQKCDKTYKKKVYLLKHEEKCVHGEYQSPQMPSPTDFTSTKTEGPLSMPSLDCKLPNGNSYCSACNKEFTAVGRLRLHLEKACPILKQAGIYDRVKERLQTTQEIEATKECGDQDPRTSLHVQPEASSATSGFRSSKAESELTATSSPSGRIIKERKVSLSLTKTSLNIDNADNNINPLSMGSENRTSHSYNILRHASIEGHEGPSSEPVIADSMAATTPLGRYQAPAADRTVTPALILPAQKPLGFSKASDNPPSGEDGNVLTGIESSDESDSEQLPIGEHSIQGDDKDRILGYPERTRLFSNKIISSSPSVHSPVKLFEDIPNIPKSTTARRASSRPDNTDPFGSTLAMVENKGADKVSSLIVSVPSKTLCGIAYGKIEKDIAAGGDDMKGLMVWPLYEVPASPASTFEFKITAPDGFNLIATIKEILPKLVFRHHVGKGWVAVLQTIPPARRTSVNFPANEDSRASSHGSLGVKMAGRAKLTSHGKDISGMRSSGSRSLRISSTKPGEDPEDLMQGKKRKSSRLSELNIKDKKDASVENTKRRKLGK